MHDEMEGEEKGWPCLGLNMVGILSVTSEYLGQFRGTTYIRRQERRALLWTPMDSIIPRCPFIVPLL